MASEKTIIGKKELEKSGADAGTEMLPGNGAAKELERERAKRKRAEAAARESDERVRADLGAMKRLHAIGALYVGEGSLEAVLGEVVEAAMAISGADFGNIQLVTPDGSGLRIVGHRGFPQWWIDYWNTEGAKAGSCGAGLKLGDVTCKIVSLSSRTQGLSCVFLLV